MIAGLVIAGLSATTLWSFGGWCVERHRHAEARRRAADDRIALWRFADVVRFSGRVAWHAANDPLRPPQHLVAPHMLGAYRGGWDLEQASEDLATKSWNEGASA